MTIAGPAVEDLTRNALNKNPMSTERTLAPEETRKKPHRLPVNCRAVDAGTIINALANRAPIKRKPMRTVKPKTRRK